MMNYWGIAPGELESIMFRRPTGAAGFDGVPANFPFDVRDHTAGQQQQQQQQQQQNEQSSGNVQLHNPHSDHSAMKQQSRGQQQPQQQQQQQTGNRNIGSAQQTAMYHQQQPQQHHGSQQTQMKDMKSEPVDRNQQAATSGAHGVQVKHGMQQLNNEIFLFPAPNSQTNNGANLGPASVAGLLVTALPVTATLSNVSAAAAAAAAAATVPTSNVANNNGGNNNNNAQLAGGGEVVKPKKKKQKKAASSVPPTMVAPRPPAPRAQCLLCERNYGNRRDLRRHVLAHHEGVRYMCRLCSKVMMSSKSVRAHLKSSAHRLLHDDEIAMNIEKMTPSSSSNAPISAMNANAFNAIGGASGAASSGSLPTQMSNKKAT